MIINDLDLADTLTGSAGVDWFFRDANDVIRDARPGTEIVTDV